MLSVCLFQKFTENWVIILFDKLNYLALSTISNDPYAAQAEAAADAKEKAICIVVLLGIIIACVLISKLQPALQNMRTSKKENKAAAEKEAELERLHRIKKQNKRK